MEERNALYGAGRQCVYDLWDSHLFPIHSDEYSEQLFADRVIEYISNSEPNEPFFVYYAMPYVWNECP